jgi:hypothetical protein
MVSPPDQETSYHIVKSGVCCASQQKRAVDVRLGSMLSKKSPQKICGIGNWNERIRAHGFLNHHCASTLALESMLLGAPLQNTFSTASVKLGKAHSEH